MKEQEIREKATFLASALAVLVGLKIFKDEFLNLIIPTGFLTYSLNGLLNIIVFFLLISLYLYALSYAFGKYRQNKFYKTIIWLADTAYFVGFTLPLLAIFNSITNTLPFIKELLNYPNILIATNTIGLVGAIFAYFLFTILMINEETALRNIIDKEILNIKKKVDEVSN